jgi:hypothetical protein
MSRRKLPLQDARWWPIEQALEQHSQQTGSDKLACQDFNEALKSGPLRSLVRREDGSRELLAAAAWEDLHCSVVIRVAAEKPFARLTGMAVFSRKLHKRPPMQWFFVWLPDYENIFGGPRASLPPSAQTQEVPKKRGRKASYPWAEIGFELVRRAAKMGAVARNKSTNSWAKDLWQWCDDNNKKAPNDGELRKFVDEVFRALRIERK